MMLGLFESVIENGCFPVPRLVQRLEEKSPDEVLIFCREYNKFENRKPLIAVPTSYNTITEQELSQAGVNVVIYANHLLRSAYPAMLKRAKSIIEHGRSYEIESNLMSVSEIINFI
jgi:phosphoenolpyruvate phosphomutase